MPSKDAISGFKIYIERNEKPFNYMTWDEEDEKIRRVEYEQQIAKKAILVQERKKQEELLEKILKKQKEATSKYNLEVVREH